MFSEGHAASVPGVHASFLQLLADSNIYPWLIVEATEADIQGEICPIIDAVK
jgi:hypothetical protein